MAFEKIRILTWRNSKIRFNRCFKTLIELLLPVIMFYMYSNIHNITSKLAEGIPTDPENEYLPPTTPPSTEDIIYHVSTRVHLLLYTPSNNFTDELFKNIEFPSLEGPVEIQPAANESVIEEKVISGNYIAGVIFLGQNDGTRPNALSYKIRIRLPLNTEDLYRSYRYETSIYTLSIQDDPVYILAGLIIALDQAFITSVSANTSYSAFLPEFHPANYTTDVTKRLGHGYTIYYIIIIVVAVMALFLIKEVVAEKDSGTKELLKLVNVSEIEIWCCWFLHAFIPALISFTISTFILTYEYNGPGTAMIQYVPILMFWLFLTLYVIANISYSLMFCAIFRTVSMASSTYLITTILIGCTGMYIINGRCLICAILSSLIPVLSLMWGFEQIRLHESNGELFEWSSFTEANTKYELSLFLACCMLVFDTILYFLLAVYINLINPGKYGIPRSPFFIFEYWFCKREEDKIPPFEKLDEKYFQPPPINLEASIKIRKLYKKFGGVYAVNGLNLNVFKGEITGLIGHNGAGKSTTLSILTGLIKATSGSIYYDNLKISNNMKEFREKLGFCPQENRLYPYLSVFDHLILFGMLRGATITEAEKEASEYLRLMKMERNKTEAAGNLPPGMKRIISLFIALMGKVEVLILDEPTSSLDVYSRRKFWDILLSVHRKDRTIILCTHYMKEVDILADRIVIMNHGKVVGYGTPTFLKMAYNSSYFITINKGQIDTNELTQIIQNFIPDVLMQEETHKKVVYMLPPSSTNKFRELFQNLENRLGSLGMQQITVTYPTMEKVFFKSGYFTSAHNATFTPSSSNVPNVQFKGLRLVCQQIRALYAKRCLYVYKNLFTLFFQVGLTTFIGVLMLLGFNNSCRNSQHPLQLSLRLYKDPHVMLQNYDSNLTGNISSQFADYVKRSGGSLIISNSHDLPTEITDFGMKKKIIYSQKLLFAGAFNDSGNTIMYNPWMEFALPISLNTYSNALIKTVAGNNFSISVIYQPSFPPNSTMFAYRAEHFHIVWFITMGLFTTDVLGYLTTYINEERLDGFQHLQLVSKLSPNIYWTTMFSFDLLFFVVVMSARLIIFHTFVDPFNVLSFHPDIHYILGPIILYGISGVLFTYLFVFLINNKGGEFNTSYIFNMCCGVIALLYNVGEQQKSLKPTMESFFWILKYIILVTAPMNYQLILLRFLMVWYHNNLCKYYQKPFELKWCETDDFKRKEYWENVGDDIFLGIKEPVEFFCYDIILYAILLYVIHSRFVKALFSKMQLFVCGCGLRSKIVQHESVEKNNAEILRLRRNPKGHQNSYVLIVYWLLKTYNWLNRFTAVENVAFLVKHGKCFGLLGNNNAGKSTTYKMLTAEIEPSEGDAAIYGAKLFWNRRQYLNRIGYCPQQNSFIECFTVREMLNLIASLRGIPYENRSKVVNLWMERLDLTEPQHTKCAVLSGGTKRRLCIAMSFIGDPEVMLLDEPTVGLDPGVQQKFFSIVDSVKQSDRAMVFTSHNMDECKTMCDELTIMNLGKMKCVGTPEEIIKEFAPGITLVIKLSDAAKYYNSLIEKAKFDIMKMFTVERCFLQLEKPGLLYYRVKNISMEWSELFEIMETLKEKHMVINDYQLETSNLEDVFLSFQEERVIEYT